MDNLKYGSRGTDVELLQLALTRSGYYNSPYGIDGIFGADTQNAVRRFQAAFGLRTALSAGTRKRLCSPSFSAGLQQKFAAETRFTALQSITEQRLPQLRRRIPH